MKRKERCKLIFIKKNTLSLQNVIKLIHSRSCFANTGLENNVTTTWNSSFDLFLFSWVCLYCCCGLSVPCGQIGDQMSYLCAIETPPWTVRTSCLGEGPPEVVWASHEECSGETSLFHHVTTIWPMNWAQARTKIVACKPPLRLWLSFILKYISTLPLPPTMCRFLVLTRSSMGRSIPYVVAFMY